MNRGKFIQGGSRGIRLPPIQQHNAGGGGCQGRQSRLSCPWHPAPAVLLGHTLGKVDSHLGVDQAPVLPPAGPLFRNIHHRQIQHFQQTVVCLENALGFCNLPQLPVKALDRVRGIDQTADLLRVLEVGAEIGPVGSPGLRNFRVFFIPALPKGVQSIQRCLLVYSGIDRFQIGHKGFQVLVGHVLAGIAQLVDDTVLDLGLGEGSMNRRVKPRQIVGAGDENILYTPVFQAVQYSRPELG